MITRKALRHLREIAFPGDTSCPSSLTNCSHPENHHFRGFDECGRAVTRFQAQLFCGIGGDNGSDVLLADRQRHLGEQSAELERDDAPNQLVSTANLAEVQAPCREIAPFQLFWNEPVDFAFRHAMVPTRSLHGLEFAVVDPLLQCGIADAENVRRLARRQEFLHGSPPVGLQNITYRNDITMRLYTITGLIEASSLAVCRSSKCARCAPGSSFRRRGRRRLRARDRECTVR